MAADRRRRGFIRAFIALLVCVAGGCESRDPLAVKGQSIRRGNELLQKKQYAQAAAAYQVAASADPRDPFLRRKLANAYQLAGNWAQAAEEAVRAANLVPSDIDAQLFAATLLNARGRFAESGDRMSSLLLAQPDNVSALIVWANAKAHLSTSTRALSKLADLVDIPDEYRKSQDLRPDTDAEDDEAAEEAFRKALGLAPTSMDAQLALANFLWATNRSDESEELLRRVADANPRHAIANRALGGYYWSRQREAEGEHYLKNAAATGEFGRGARLALADYYISHHRDDDAMAILRSAGEAEDSAGVVSMRAAGIEIRQGKYDDAIRRLDTLLAREPRNGPAMALKSRGFLAKGDIDQALRVGRTAVAQDPRAVDARVALGKALSAGGDLTSAFGEFAEALRLDPGATELSIELARIAVALGRSEEATLQARQALRQHPGNRDAALILVKALVLSHDYLAAEKELEPLLSRSPVSADVLVQSGTIQAARGNPDAARATFVRALTLDPQSFEALSGLTSLDLRDGKAAAAQQRVEAVLAAHSKDPRYLELAAQVYSAQRDVSRTERTYRQILEIDKANIGAAISLAELLARQRRVDEARRLLDQLIQRWPQSAEVRTAAAGLLEQAGRAAEARAQYEKILADDPHNAVAAQKLAAFFAAQNENLEVALGLARMAKQQRPDDSAVSDTLGWIYVRKQMPALAVPHLRDAVRAAPDNARYRYHLGIAYKDARQVQQAIDELTHALRLDENLPEADDARSTLEMLRRVMDLLRKETREKGAAGL